MNTNHLHIKRTNNVTGMEEINITVEKLINWYIVHFFKSGKKFKDKTFKCTQKISKLRITKQLSRLKWKSQILKAEPSQFQDPESWNKKWIYTGCSVT